MKNFKNSFGNLENVKYQVTQITQNDAEFYQILNNIQGDKFQKGISFDKLVLHSLNYLFVNCVNSSDLLDSDWNLDFAKALLDKNNCTGYTAVLSSPNCRDIEVYKKQYYKEAFAFIQLAYYLNSIDLRANQFFIYINHYLTTKTKLPDSNYKLDIDYLHKKYNDLDNTESDFKITAENTLKSHFYGCLFIICNDLGLNTSNFKLTAKVGREYNALVKVNREFRKYFPFLLDEYDIRCANPHFIDLQINSNVADGIYEEIAEKHHISRSKAKQLYNKYLNSGKYHNRSYFKAFFEPVYKEYTEELIDLIKDKKTPLWSLMQNWESIAIKTMVDSNNIKHYTRLHDGIFIINNKYQEELRTKFPSYEFDYKQINKIDGDLNFKVSKKKPKYNYVSSIPSSFNDLNIAFQKDTKKGLVYKGKFFNVYKEKFKVWKSSFNISFRGSISPDGDYKEITQEEFIKKLKYSIDVIDLLNENISIDMFKSIIQGIVEHIYLHGCYSFNTNYLTNILFNHLEEGITYAEPKIRKWHFKGNSDKNNFNIYQFNQNRYQDERDAKTYFGAKDIIKVVKDSYRDKVKRYIRLSDLGYNDKRHLPVISDLIDRFNGANGFNDGREVKTLIKWYTKIATLYNSNNTLAEIVYHPSSRAIAKELNIHRKTASKIKKWFEEPQDEKELKAIINQLNTIIDAQIDANIELKNDLPLMNWNDAFNKAEEEVTITKTEEKLFKVNVNIKQVPQPLYYSDSVLNCNIDRAIKNDSYFITSWYLFQNPDLSESIRSLIKHDPSRTSEYVKMIYYNDYSLNWNRDLYLNMNSKAS